MKEVSLQHAVMAAKSTIVLTEAASDCPVPTAQCPLQTRKRIVNLTMQHKGVGDKSSSKGKLT